MQVSSLPFQASVISPRQAGKSPVNTLHFGTAPENQKGFDWNRLRQDLAKEAGQLLSSSPEDLAREARIQARIAQEVDTKKLNFAQRALKIVQIRLAETPDNFPH
jgi:hypothetical protein